jgi:hypothetical protein
MPDITDPNAPPADPAPIVVADPAGAQIASASRTLLIAIGAYAAGKGWVNSDLINAAIPLVIIIASGIWGQLAVLRIHAKAKKLADLLPNQVAIAK